MSGVPVADDLPTRTDGEDRAAPARSRFASWIQWALVALALAAAQAAYFAFDRSPQTSDPSLQVHLSYRLAEAWRARDVAAIFDAWTSSSNLYPPLFPLLHAGLAGLQASVRVFRASQSLWLLFLSGVLIWSGTRRHDGATPAVVALLATSAPLTLCLARVTYIENLLVLLVVTGVLLLRDRGLPKSRPHAVLFGAVVGLAVFAKWSALVVLVPAAAASWFARDPGTTWSATRRHVLLAAVVAAGIAGPWYASGGFRWLDQIAWQAFEKPGMTRPLLSLDALLFYPRAAIGEAFWLPVGCVLALLLLIGVRRLPAATLRFWGITLLGALVVLTISRHKQVRFLAALVPLVAVLAGEALATLPRRARHGLTAALLALCLVPLVGLSIPSGAGPRAGAPDPPILSPARGIPSLRLGPPDPTLWPHGDLLEALARRGLRGEQARVFFDAAQPHPYLNRWTFRAEGWPRCVRFAEQARHTVAVLTCESLATPPVREVWLSTRSPDGHLCTIGSRNETPERRSP